MNPPGRPVRRAAPPTTVSVALIAACAIAAIAPPNADASNQSPDARQSASAQTPHPPSTNPTPDRRGGRQPLAADDHDDRRPTDAHARQNPWTDFALGAAGLALFTLLAFGVFAYLKRRIVRPDDTPNSFTLDGLRAMRTRGDLTEEEFHAARNALIRQLRPAPQPPQPDAGATPTAAQRPATKATPPAQPLDHQPDQPQPQPQPRPDRPDDAANTH